MSDGKHEAPAGSFSTWADLTWARAKKAYSAGLGGAAAALGLVSWSGLWADGLDKAAVGQALLSVLGGFAVGFVTAFFPRNE